MISKQSCFTVNAVMSSQEWPILVAMMSAATAGVRCSQLAREKKKCIVHAGIERRHCLW